MAPNRNWSARVGEAIIGELGRGGGGQFTRVGSGGGPPAGPAGQGKPPAPGPAQGATPAAQPPQGADQMAAFLAEAGLDPQLAESLGEYLSGQASEEPEDIALNRQAAEALAQLGLVAIREGQEGASNVGIDLTPQGLALADAMQAGDKEATAAALSGEAAPGGPAAAQDPAEEKKKGGGGGGGGGGKEPEAAQDPAQTRAATAQQVGLAPDQADALAQAAEGGTDPQAAGDLVEAGLVDDQGQATPGGRAALAALEKGDARAYHAAVQKAQELRQRQQERARLEVARQQQAQARQAGQDRRAADANQSRIDAANIAAGRNQQRLQLAQRLGARSIAEELLDAALAAYDAGIAEEEAALLDLAGVKVAPAGALLDQAPIGGVKAIDAAAGRLQVTGIVYGGRDLVGDQFTAATDIGRGRRFEGMPVYYDHGLRGVKSQIGQVVETIDTDEGLDFTVELDRRHRYAGEVLKLAEAGALGGSTGALSHLIVRKAGQLKRWIIGELSLTPTPAEPRTRAAAMKTSTRPEAGPQAAHAATGPAARRPILIVIERKAKA